MSLDHIRIVLVEPRQPGNIGSVARAMKNTGLSRLVLVSPADHTCGDARKMAVGSGDILYGATVVDTFDEAVADCAFVAGTAHRKRKDFDLLHGPQETAGKLLSAPAGRDVALVFGREESGLSNDEIKRCNILSHVHTPVKYPSLNLSQAVLLFGYELFRAVKNPPEPPKLDVATYQAVETMYAHIAEALDRIGFIERNRPDSFMRSIRRTFGRMPLERRDVATVHKLCRQVNRFIARHHLPVDAEPGDYTRANDALREDGDAEAP